MTEENLGKMLRLIRHLRADTSSRISRRFSTLPQQDTLSKYREGQVIHGFVVERVEKIDEVFITAVKLRHMGCGAQYLHLERDDSNNLFCVGLRTTPTDSTGLPHILEHTTLCGSQKFPARDPFFKMLRRSLATFMNAFTGPDYTFYPFSTQNQKDFKNLQSVYLDSVFKPNLKAVDFRQEGWRLEHADVNDKNSPIVFKGVVFNEMKGVFNENQAIFGQRLLNALLPSDTYQYVYGGDPLEIPKLTHKNLVDFHAHYYHPSNSRIYSYGNFPLESHLQYVNDQYLLHANKEDASKTAVPSEPRWDTPRTEHITCRPDPMAANPKRQSHIAISHLCNDVKDVQTTFEMYVVAQLLLKGPNSAFYKSLIDENNVSSGFGSSTGYEVHCRDSMFTVNLQGVDPNDFEKIIKIYDETVDKIVQQGFEMDRVEAILHEIELQVKHQTSNFGLSLLFNIIPLWNHDGDIIQSLKINQAMSSLKSKLEKDPAYLQSFVAKYLKNNTHRLTLTMSPDERYDEIQAAKESELLEAKLKQLSTDDLERIYKEGQELEAEQQKEEDPNVLPTLQVSDLKSDVDRYNVEDKRINGVPTQTTYQPTNGITYYKGILNTSHLSHDHKMLLPLFNAVITKMGTQNYDYKTFDHKMQLKTGGIHFSNHVAVQRDSEVKHEEGVIFESFCLDRNSKDMFNLLSELFNNLKLEDMQRFETLVKISAANLVNSIADHGHVHAMSRACSLVTETAALKENLGGLEFITRMKKIAQMKDLGPILEQLRIISENVLNKNHLRTALNMSAENKDEILRDAESFYKSLSGNCQDSKIITQVNSLDKEKKTQRGVQYVLPYTVNYASKAILGVPFSHPDFAPLTLLAKLLSSVYLHPEVREKGGAYGGGARMSNDGIFMFYSYRDPNSTRTFDVFDKSYEFLQDYKLTEKDINEAKLGVFQQIDAPISPANRCILRFTHGLTYDDVQNHRTRLIATGQEDLVNVAEKYLNPSASRLIGRAFIGQLNADLLSRQTENWSVVQQEEQKEMQAAE